MFHGFTNNLRKYISNRDRLSIITSLSLCAFIVDTNLLAPIADPDLVSTHADNEMGMIANSVLKPGEAVSDTDDGIQYGF
jgi:hypothetical protein